MLWVLWDIVLPLIATFLLGLLVGWLLWRWRRSRIDAEGLSKLRRASSRNTADFERLQQSNIELSDRLQAASGAGGSGELASSKKRIEMLASELKSSREEVAELRSSSSGSDATDSDASIEMQNLQIELDLAQSRITELESAEHGIGSVSGISADDDLHQEIAARDRMIATLEQSLQQFGERGDTTTLLADIVLRDRKIEELEAMIGTLKR